MDATRTCDTRKNDYTIDWETGTMTLMVNTLLQEIIIDHTYQSNSMGVYFEELKSA